MYYLSKNINMYNKLMHEYDQYRSANSIGIIIAHSSGCGTLREYQTQKRTTPLLCAEGLGGVFWKQKHVNFSQSDADQQALVTSYVSRRACCPALSTY